MRTLHHRLAGAPVYIHYYEGHGDDARLLEWLAEERPVLGLDTETTGLDIYARHFATRLVQVGDKKTAWVIPARHKSIIQEIILTAPLLAMHNAPHDLHTIDRHFGIPLEETHPKTVDTMLLAHILDPRSSEDGQHVGHGLKALAAAHVDPEAEAGQKALKAVFKARGWTIDEGWNLIEEDNEDYVRYSGLDPIETAHLFDYLWPLVADNKPLIKFEHKVQRLLAKMERRGIRLDVEYTQKLQAELDQIVTENDEQAVQMFKDLGAAKLTPRAQRGVHDAIHIALGGMPHKYNVKGELKPLRRQTDGKLYESMSVGSNQVVVKALQLMGEELTKKTDTGALAVDSEVLNLLCDVDKDDERMGAREPNPLARLVKDGKRAGKWRSSYADTMLEIRDDKDRVHTKIASLKARTARMAVSHPPFQQLPSNKGRMIRDCLLADPGHLLISSDYDQVEMKLLAGLLLKHVGDDTMAKVMAEGLDIFDWTSEQVYGAGFTKRQRGALKATGYGTCYGGGPNTISQQTGLTYAQAKEVQTLYLDTFPGIREYSKLLQDEALANDYAIYTPLYGRRMPVDENRVYAALNYMIQSTARDIFAEALLRLDKAGLESYLLLPVHDEVLAQAPTDEAPEIARRIGETMTTRFNDVDLTATGEVIGTRWGDAYA